MGLKCSLLGHSFDEADVEREREERGSEVVTIIREVERCSRCGTSRTVSENKEVTSIVEPEATESAVARGESGGGEPEGVQLAESPDPDEDDAEILRNGRPAERTPGQWPDDDEPWEPDVDEGAGDGGPDEGAGADVDADADQAVDADEEDTEAVIGDDHAEVLDDGPAADTGDGKVADAGGGSVSPGATAGGGEILDGGRDQSPGEDDGGTTSSESRFVCPECGFTTRANSTSLREGDACPECQRGYLDAERNP